MGALKPSSSNDYGLCATFDVTEDARRGILRLSMDFFLNSASRPLFPATKLRVLDQKSK